MEKLNLHILSLNKRKKRYFGVDYFVRLTNGNNSLFKYYSTPLDPSSVYKTENVTLLTEMYHFLDIELEDIPKGSIIGLFMNPDIYQVVDSIKPLLNIIKKNKMGFFIETNSPKIIEDLEILRDFEKELPLLISVPGTVVVSGSNLFDIHQDINNVTKIIQKARNLGINCGLTIKPIIPFINDDVNHFNNIISMAFNAKATFIYPTFTIRFDSSKLKEFYNIVDLEFPELMNKFHDLYGQKQSWESPNAAELKKNYVIFCRKNKILYAMKDIINIYKPDLNIQLKLF